MSTVLHNSRRGVKDPGGIPFGIDTKPDWMDSSTYLALRGMALKDKAPKAPKAPLAPLQAFSAPSIQPEPTQVQIPSGDVFQKMLEYLAARSRAVKSGPSLADSEGAAVRMT